MAPTMKVRRERDSGEDFGGSGMDSRTDLRTHDSIDSRRGYVLGNPEILDVWSKLKFSVHRSTYIQNLGSTHLTNEAL